MPDEKMVERNAIYAAGQERGNGVIEDEKYSQGLFCRI